MNSRKHWNSWFCCQLRLCGFWILTWSLSWVCHRWNQPLKGLIQGKSKINENMKVVLVANFLCFITIMDNHEISNENWERNVTTWDHLFGLTIKVIWHVESLMSSTSIHCYRYVWICVCHCKACSLPRERGVALHIHFLALASLYLASN